MNEAVAAAQTDGNALSRSLRPRHVAMITIGGIIGAGLFVGSSVAITAAGPAIVITYALTGSLVLLIMRMLGEMAVDMPQVRSFTEFTRAALGNWAGFSVGWLYWYFWVVVIPVEAIAGAGIIEHWLPLPRWEVGLALMALMTWVNLMSVRAYGEFEFWFSSIKVAAIMSLIVSTVPWNRVVAGQSPFTLALDEIHFPYASEFMAAVILTAVLSCLNSAFYVASRVLFVLASRGDAPRWLVRTNRRHVPARAVLLAGAVGFAGVIAAILSPSVVFAFLVNASGAIIAVIYLAIAVSQVRSRRVRERAGGPAAALPRWVVPWLSYLAIAAMVLVLIAMALTPSHRAEVWTSTISIGVTLLAYVLFRRRRK